MTDDPTICDQMFKILKFTKSGGMWGDAQWLKISDRLAVAVGGASDAVGENSDFTNAPTNMFFPCMVFIYDSERVKDWNPASGEAPEVDYDSQECRVRRCENVAEAIRVVMSVRCGIAVNTESALAC